MLKLLFLAAVLATVSANVLEKYVGEIVLVRMHPREKNLKFCVHFGMSVSKKNCTCGGSAVPVLKWDILGQKLKLPVQIVGSETEALHALKNQCECNRIPVVTTALIPFNDNYFIIYAKESLTDYTTVLFAKNKPSPKELDDFVKTTDGLEDRPEDIVCTTESPDFNSLNGEEEKESSISKIRQSFGKI